MTETPEIYEIEVGPEGLEAVIRTVPSQIVRLEPVVAEIVGGGTSAVAVRGADGSIPEGAVMVVPSASVTG